jgi:tol-pal system protein YbgF
LLALSLAPAACGAGAAKELAVVRDELTKVQQEHAALSKRVEDLEARDDKPKSIAITEAPAASTGAVEAKTDGKPLKVVKLEPNVVVANEPTTSGDDDEPRPMLKIGPSGAVEQTMPDEGSKPGKKPSVSKNPVLDPQAAKDYDAAYAFIKAKKPKAALDAFGAFIVRYPDHPYAANALYWRGESYYSLADYGNAIAQFDALAIRYPASLKLPDALLRMGLAHRKLGSPVKARAAFDKLKKEFPASEAAKKIPTEDAS